MMKIHAEKEAHYGWKFFIILLTSWIVILEMNPASVVSL